MIENTAIFKAGGSLAIVGGTTGCAYYAHTRGVLSFQNATSENEEAKDYFIVKSTKFKSTASGQIYDYGLFTSPTKNFTCLAKISTSDGFDEDKKCEIYKLSDKEKALAKAIDNNFGATTKNIQEEGHYFKITAPDFYGGLSEFDSEEQMIHVSQTTDKDKFFGKLMPIYKVENGEIIGRKNSFLYAKVKDSVGTNPTQPTNEMKESDEKNYQCQFSSEKFDCLIIELTVNATNKTIEDPKNVAPKNEKLKTKDTLFRIEMQEKYLNKFTFENDSNNIDLIEKVNPSTSNKYAILTPLFKTLDNEISGKDSFLLSVATTETNNTAATTGYKKCKIDDLSEAFNCDIYKFATSQTVEKDINFSGTLTKTENGTEIKANEYFVIKIPGNKVNINNLSPKTQIKLGTDKSTDKEWTFTVKKRLFLDPATENTMTVNFVHFFDI